MNITLDARLKADTYPLGEFDGSLLLLSKNALFPWFVLVPETQEIEFHKLSTAQQSRTQQQINAVAQFIETRFSPDKINIATIGNIVSQLHIHIIGRNKNDVCWPGVVWGTPHFKDYEAQEVGLIKNQLEDILKGIFRTADGGL
jgi:diadenosine tetraphosphate (Ap4A) HIT family hydrolase